MFESDHYQFAKFLESLAPYQKPADPSLMFYFRLQHWVTLQLLQFAIVLVQLAAWALFAFVIPICGPVLLLVWLAEKL